MTTWFASREWNFPLITYLFIKWRYQARRRNERSKAKAKNNSFNVIFSRKKIFFMKIESLQAFMMLKERHMFDWEWNTKLIAYREFWANLFIEEQISPSEYRLSFSTRFVFHSIFIMFCLLHIVKNNSRERKINNKRPLKKLEQQEGNTS